MILISSFSEMMMPTCRSLFGATRSQGCSFSTCTAAQATARMCEPFFGEIEKNFAMVYWNQRAAGESQGNVKPRQMNIAQFVEDTEKVVALINKLYDHPRIFL